MYARGYRGQGGNGDRVDSPLPRLGCGRSLGILRAAPAREGSQDGEGGAPEEPEGEGGLKLPC